MFLSVLYGRYTANVLNILDHFFFLSWRALTNLDSLLLKASTLNLSKSFNCCLFDCLM